MAPSRDLRGVALVLGVSLAAAAGCEERDTGPAASPPPAPSTTTMRRATAPFECETGRCIQRHPRVPDDGEWSCADSAGAAVCRRKVGDTAAIPWNEQASSFRCGVVSSQRVCVDLAPDFPDDKRWLWRCRYEAAVGLTRVCERSSQTLPVLGAPCDADRRCVDGAACVSGRCAARPATPTCLYDRECASNNCSFGYCSDAPPSIPARHVSPRAPRQVEAQRGCIDVPRRLLGPSAEVTLRVHERCRSRKGRWRWSVGGAASARGPLTGVELKLRTQSLAQLISPPAWGPVPVSASGQGRVWVTLEHEPSGDRFSEDMSVLARSPGLPNTPTGRQLLVAGSGWSLIERPEEAANTRLEPLSGLVALTPEVAGKWLLRDGEGRELSLFSGSYAAMPLDCGRCHAAVTRAALESPMARALEPRLPARRGCTPRCHVVGEPHAADTGFFALARQMGVELTEVAHVQELPRALRRQGGVGCLACHGPGAIPEPAGRWAIYRTGVCAQCHDEAPRYGHGQAWRESAMARSDQAPETRGGECASCHTARGFVAWQRQQEAPPPAPVALGIGCSACHAPHSQGAGERLLRPVRVPKRLGGVPTTARVSRVCVPCHSPREGETLPSASAAALWLGRGGLQPKSGAPLSGARVHGHVPKGCVGCHQGGPAGVESGRGHAFQAGNCVDGGCHTRRPAPDPSLRLRAERLWQGHGPSHHSAARQTPPSSPKQRALYDVALVLQDRGAWAHDPTYARALLDAAAEVLEAPAGGAK